MEKILYGVAYYREYMPYERLQEDIAMMKKANINVVRIAESTWSTYEKRPGKFDFSTVVEVIDAMEEAGIDVIIGTPTYAVPSWLVELDPTVMVEKKGVGRMLYGMRQSMDITNKTYLYYAERIIRELMKVTAHRKNVIGFQLDNETKAYGTSSKNVQLGFIEYLKDMFDGDLEELNKAYGLNYWSNRIDSWENFPDVNGTINASLGAAFEKYQRLLVDEFLNWQASIVKEYARKDQFVTQNFDFEWRGVSYGVQPEVNHTTAARCLSIAGCDIYHLTQDQLTGEEIAFCGDSTRCLKQNNYLVLETQAQGFNNFLPYQHQLTLQAYSHLASGANAVMYWHWHSIHNAAESYWKGLLSHDFRENTTYLEAVQIGAELNKLSFKLVNLKKKNTVALLVSNDALTALKWFPVDIQSTFQSTLTYNDIVRAYYRQLYQLNIECDIVTPDTPNWSDYDVLVVPALYSAPDSVYQELERFVRRGGKLLASFKTAVANEHLQISYEGTPKNLEEVFGITYNEFSTASGQTVTSEYFHFQAPRLVPVFLEYVQATTATELAVYDFSGKGNFAAITSNEYGKGRAVYIGCTLDEHTLKEVITRIFEDQFDYSLSLYQFPIISREGINDAGDLITYLFNYSQNEHSIPAVEGTELRLEKLLQKGEELLMRAWDVRIIETKQ